jgi:glucose/arabinose dehydrogenase
VTQSPLALCAELSVSMFGNHRGERGAVAAPHALAALVVVVLTLALAACGSSSPTSRSASETSQTVSQTSQSALQTSQTVSETTPPAKDGVDPAKVRMTNVRLAVPAANRSGAFTSTHHLSLPQDWTAEVWTLVNAVRFETWTPEGDLLVSAPTEGTVTLLRPRAGNQAAPPAQRTIIDGLRGPQGMAFDRIDGQEVLYVAESDEVDRYVWKGAGVGTRTVLIKGLPDAQPAGDDIHELKDVVVGRDHTIYVDVGSSSNASPRVSWHGIPRASVLAYHPNGQLERVWATGVRNGDGLSFAPDGSLWTAVNERDSITYPFHRAYGGSGNAYNTLVQSYVNNHPPDEIARLNPGRDLGWPYCDPDPDVHPGAPHTALRYTNLPFIRDAQTNAGGQRLNCAKLARLQVGLPAHSAPLGFHFLIGSKLPAPWSNGAVVAGHGSWDRQPPRPPTVYWMPWSQSRHTLGAPQVLVGGFQEPNGSRWGRVVDAVPGPDGALYVSDDQAGAIYRIVPTSQR